MLPLSVQLLSLIHICIVQNEGFSGRGHRLFKRMPAVPANRDAANLTCPKKENKDNVLVVDYRIPKYDVSAGERATWGILLDLKALGYTCLLYTSRCV